MAESGEYKHGMCGCCGDIGTCCFVTWCFPCAQGKYRGEVRGEGFNTLHCLISWCVPWVGEYLLRSSVQQAYGIREGGCTTCMAVCCCPCCATIQDAREIRHRKDTATIVSAQPQPMEKS
eukprot:comp18559_c0_seq1/m.20043 comp18559_c0_seq1/g.20043  ORF comp18559_c0_seq1/g.20043 comp18559_c0_seq1/m.20043 type:complete len:120 (-) comp18559_c0_seq1:629-988(-)